MFLIAKLLDHELAQLLLSYYYGSQWWIGYFIQLVIHIKLLEHMKQFRTWTTWVLLYFYRFQHPWEYVIEKIVGAKRQQ